MPEAIDTFYVIDFDRCLGNFDATMELIINVVEDFSVLKGAMIIQANKDAKLNGKSLSVSRFLIENDHDLDLGEVHAEYINRAQTDPHRLLEPGALELIEYLSSNKYPYCIMTFGDENWQKTKIKAVGLDKAPVTVVEHERKSHIIANWLDKETGLFRIPVEYASSKNPVFAKEVVLIDDKPAAFDNLEASAKGYLVSEVDLVGSYSGNVTQVSSLNDIIRLEKLLKKR